MSGHSDWAHIYQQNIPNQAHTSWPSDRTCFDTTFEPKTMSTTTPTSTTTASTSPTHLSPDGRVSKPVRRRSRASRRTPTTLLNTDTSNFRAMVQQFTGGPNASFTMEQHPNPASGFAFGFNNRQQVAQANPNIPQAMVPNLQYQSMTQMPTPHHRQEQFMFSLRNPSMELPGGGFGAVDGEGVGGSQMMPSRARQGPATSLGENVRSNMGGFLF